MSTNDKQKIITRFPPSPTGLFHIGSARTALFNYLFARQNGGKFILRIEDTDKERSKKEFEIDILKNMEWLGMEWDEPLYRQSERGEVYKKYLQKLLDEDKAYISKEENKDDKPVFGKAAKLDKIRSESVIRFRNSGTKITFNDLIRGEISFDTTELGDFVIAKDIETPLYHLAVVVDDFEMGVTHIIRGEDGLSNTPRQILIQEAIGATRPIYAHLPLILGPDKSKLSKRHGAASINEYRELGYLPETIINFLAFIGWNPGDEREIFSIDELIKEFNLGKVKKGGAVFNIEKLDWMNGEYLKKIDPEKFKEWTGKYAPVNSSDTEMWHKILTLLINDKRINKPSDIKSLWEAGELHYFFSEPIYEKEMLLCKSEIDLKNTKKHLQKVAELLNALDENDFMSQNIKDVVMEYADREGRGNVLWPWRIAVTGLKKSPDLFSVSSILGKEETVKRIKNAMEKIG